MTTRPTFRFAPSPNGELHLGHAYSALVTQNLAEATGGRFLLRIEDVDGGRARKGFEQQIYDDLEWLGLTWETPVRRQSDFMADYAGALQKLTDLGVLYPCFATRREILDHPLGKRMPENPDGVPVYPGIYRDLPHMDAERRIAGGEPYALRLDMAKAVRLAREKVDPISFRERQPTGDFTIVTEPPEVWGDVVLARKEIPTSYTLAVVVDDALQGVTHVTRGEDLYYATSLQRLLQILLDLPEPLYYHHPLIVDMTGRKLSKSDEDVSLKTIRATGITPEQLRLQLPPLTLN
jgi:glutamyl-Q tRNA(Asp) synthetase